MAPSIVRKAAASSLKPIVVRPTSSNPAITRFCRRGATDALRFRSCTFSRSPRKWSGDPDQHGFIPPGSVLADQALQQPRPQGV